MSALIKSQDKRRNDRINNQQQALIKVMWDLQGECGTDTYTVHDNWAAASCIKDILMALANISQHLTGSCQKFATVYSVIY